MTAAAQRARHQSVRSPERNRPDSVLEVLVVDLQFAFVDEPGARPPALQAVIARPRRSSPVRRLQPLQQLSAMERVQHRSRL